MPTTFTADPELERHTGPEPTPEAPRRHPHPDHRNLDGASTDGLARESRDVEAALDAGEIALLAYRYWQDRGCPDGCPEEDWYRAERELSENRANGSSRG